MIICTLDQPEEKANVTDRILHSLPDWFELEDGIQDYITGVKNGVFFVAMEDERPVGFLALRKHNQYTLEIYVMGVLPQYHRRGIGRQLVEHARQHAKRANYQFMFVKTLAEESHDSFYAKTRHFYQAVGFLPLFTDMQIWGEDNPCLVMVMKL